MQKMMSFQSLKYLFIFIFDIVRVLRAILKYPIFKITETWQF